MNDEQRLKVKLLLGWLEQEERGRWKYSKKRAKEYRANPSDLERQVMVILDKHKVKYSFQVAVGRYIVDFVFEERKLILEVDGFWHRVQEGEVKEHRDVYLKAFGYTVIHLSEFEDSFEQFLVNNKIITK